MNEKRTVSVKVSVDGGEAELFAPAGLGADKMTIQALREQLKQANVITEQDVDGRLAEFVTAYGTGQAELRKVIAIASKPTYGNAGRFEWVPAYDPKGTPENNDADKSEGVDFYAGRTYVSVKAGAIVGRFLPPTRGTPGRDVRGRVLEGLTGSPAPVEFDKTLYCDSSSMLVARTDGILVFTRNRICVSQVLEVAGDVDFSSGHIDFAGDVNVARGVKTGFKVKSGGTLTVDGLIEVTEIACVRDLVLRTGMAGNGSGSVEVGGDARVGYLKHVVGTINGSLVAQREIVDCNLVIGGDLRCPNGTVFGGEIAITGSLIVKVLGSEAFKPTMLVLGDVPLLKKSRHEIVKSIDQLEIKMRDLDGQERCIRLNPRPSPAERERMTEFAFERSELKQEHEAGTKELARLDIAFKTDRKLDVQITKVIFPNVKMRIGEYSIHFKEMVRGPLVICWDAHRHLMCRIGSSEPLPLSTFAHVMRDASAAVGPRAKAA